MPIYEYRCVQCQGEFDQLVATMSQADQPVECPTCRGEARRKVSLCSVNTPSGGSPASSGGHQHSGSCGCGIPRGSCPMMQ